MMSQTNVPQYSLLVGFIYLFNLIMGTGVLALPAAFQNAGWLISVVVLTFLCFASFLSYSFIVEALSISNAVEATRRDDADKRSTTGEDTPLLNNDAMIAGNNERSVFEIDITFQLADMFDMFFGTVAKVLFYINIVVYLFGDLAIYSTGFSVTLRNIVCETNFTHSANITGDDPCRAEWSLTRMEMYRILVACFAVCVGPFMFRDVTRSKWLQLFTVSLRWLAFLLLITMAIERAILLRARPFGQGLIGISHWNPAVLSLVTSGDTQEPIPTPALIRPDGIINLFGICIYAFMCHHSVTPLITPIRDKRNLFFRLSLPLFLSVLLFNIAISGTAVLAFNHVASLYTLNFLPDEQYIEISKLPHLLAKIIGYLLLLFPTFVFISVFPIVGTTLSGNLLTLTSLVKRFRTPGMQRNEGMHRLMYVGVRFLVWLLPVAIALSGDNVGLLVGYTGAFGGTGIQYVIPALLVYRARRHWAERCDQAHSSGRSPYASPFQHTAWIVLLIIWAVLAFTIVLANRIYSLVHG